MTLRKLLPGLCFTLLATLLLVLLLFSPFATTNAAYAVSYTVTLSDDVDETYNNTAFTLTPVTTGFTAPSYAWYKDDEQTPVSTASALSVRNVIDSGEYRVVVTENTISRETRCTVAIQPREVKAVDITATKTYYGDEPAFMGQLAEGSYAEGEEFKTLGISWIVKNSDDDVRELGTHALVGTITNPNYTGTVEDSEVTVVARPVTVSLQETYALYGDEFVAPEVTVHPILPDGDENDVLPYEETVEDLLLTIRAPKKRDVGEYRLVAESANPHYIVTTSESPYYNYFVLQRKLSLRFDDAIPFTIVSGDKNVTLNTFMIQDGTDSVTPAYHVEGVLPEDNVSFTVSYAQIKENETLGEYGSAIAACGYYNVRVEMNDPTGNYIAPDYKQAVASGVYTTKSNGVILHSESGFIGVEPTVTFVNGDSYRRRFDKDTFLQSVDRVFTIGNLSTLDSHIDVWVPIRNEKIDYTIGFEKNEKKMTYTVCTKEDGFIHFSTSTKNRTIAVWKDDDNFPFATAAFILFAFLIVELGLLVALLNKYRLRKNYAFAALPLAFSLFGGAGIHYFFALTIVEGVLVLGLIVAILVVFNKYRKTVN